MDANALVSQIGYWSPIVGAIATVVGGIFWLKSLKSDIVEIKTNHLPHFQKAIDELPSKLKESITEPIVKELQEQRQDLREIVREAVLRRGA